MCEKLKDEVFKDADKIIKYSKRFCTSDDDKITSALELNKIKIEGYMRNIKIEELKVIRSIETLDLNNFYLLSLYLKDIYYIFLHFVTHLTNEEEKTLKQQENIRNAFLFNTEIQNYDSFLEFVKKRMLCRLSKKDVTTQANNLTFSKDSSIDVTSNVNESRCVTSNYVSTEDPPLDKEPMKENLTHHCKEHHEYKSMNESQKKNESKFEYINELFQDLYSKDEITLLNIDKTVNDRVKKENNFDKCIRINNNISIYKLSYLYFNDKLKRLRLDYNFHFLLHNRRRDNISKITAHTTKNISTGEHASSEMVTLISNNKPTSDSTHTKTDFTIEHVPLGKEHLFLIYLSHLKYYIVSFFLYSYVRFTNANKGCNESYRPKNEDEGKIAPGSKSTVTIRENARTKNKTDGEKEQFLYNHEVNRKNVESVSSYLTNFVNKVIHDIDFNLKTNQLATNIDVGTEKKEIGSLTSELINDILKNKLSFKHITLSHLDLTLSYMVLLNLYNPNCMQSYLYYRTTFSHFFHHFEKYTTSINLWRELHRANYFCFFEDMKKLSFIERCCIFPNLKQIRIDYLHSLLYSANNRNKFSLSLNIIDECIAMHNIHRTSYMLECLGIYKKNERIYFNMSNRRVETGSIEDMPRCLLVDNKYECVQNFFKKYHDTLEDYVYIIYGEKTLNREKCFHKFDLSDIVCFNP
ncbi:hypothetical protein, conserved [Plasmodium gonderi]|uniref:Uncharacterized protein n=1 Tax=Plasmodium gonderi TaxID=77519 RepID=A0A1Y1JG83_PLAGO|nr:hypothetical protein, conserved [Plasmodium gonderi]GAW80345.1 hypothetical protein, conserved [Plasmodium gonderi]